MHQRARSTPTCVGNTAATTKSGNGCAVHPHVRGEYHVPQPRREPDHRSTPTCVGNTLLAAAAGRVSAVHPHVRGEYAVIGSLVLASAGPPPRAWGIPRRGLLIAAVTRSTPTCVGNTLLAAAAGRVSAVHPHVRGEYAVIGSLVLASAGPPPRAWGIPRRGLLIAAVTRSTPTCVGNTRPLLVVLRLPWSTPTCVGNTQYYADWATGNDGPPPRAWGIRAPR